MSAKTESSPTMADVAGTVLGGVLARLDLLAEKLGIAAGQLWKFAVKAKIVEAQRDMLKTAVLLLVPFVLWGWALHVSRMHLPHDFKMMYVETRRETPTPCPTGVQGYILKGGSWTTVAPAGGCVSVVTAPDEKKEDQGLSTTGWFYTASAIIATILGLIFLCGSLRDMIDAFARIHTAEYDAFQDLLSDLSDLKN